MHIILQNVHAVNNYVGIGIFYAENGIGEFMEKYVMIFVTSFSRISLLVGEIFLCSMTETKIFR